MAVQGATSHQERWDGRGYPANLKANRIPLVARIIAVADAYTIDEDTPTVLTPIENDSDIDGDPLTITEAQADHGEVILGENNTLGYKPKPDFNLFLQTVHKYYRCP